MTVKGMERKYQNSETGFTVMDLFSSESKITRLESGGFHYNASLL